MTEQKPRGKRNSRIMGPAEASDRIDRILSGAPERFAKGRERADHATQASIQEEIHRILGRVAPESIVKIQRSLQNMGSPVDGFTIDRGPVETSQEEPEAGPESDLGANGRDHPEPEAAQAG